MIPGMAEEEADDPNEYFEPEPVDPTVDELKVRVYACVVLGLVVVLCSVVVVVCVCAGLRGWDDMCMEAVSQSVRPSVRPSVSQVSRLLPPSTHPTPQHAHTPDTTRQ
jgi:hypothetical protein